MGWLLATRLDYSYSDEIRAERNRLAAREWFFAVTLGLTWALAALVAQDLREFALLALFVIPFIAVSITDLEARVIPNRIVYPSVVLALALSWAWPDRGVVEALIGAAAGFGFILFPFLLSGGNGIAAGDVKLGGLIGAAAGWPAVIPGLLVGVVAGGVAAVAVGVSARSRRASFAYGPYLALGGIVALLFGEDIVDWYAG
ncbi:MAG TPA: A24 family peptidase [Dehalococcoidia bacterium]|nr:A24 family peptidase [Dehalococcoidia bacterium]